MSAKLPRVAKGKRPQYLDARANDALLRMRLVVVQELSVGRERIAALEALLARQGLLPEAAVEAFVGDAYWEAAQAAARAALIERVTRGMAAGLEAGLDAG